MRDTIQKIRKASYNGVDFSIPILSSTTGYYFSTQDIQPLQVSAYNALQRTTLAELNMVWNFKRFQKPRMPVTTGMVADQARFVEPSGLRILDLPVKFPGTNYRIPHECRQFVEVIMQIVNCEVTINPLTDLFYAYLTVDQDPVKKGFTQRKPGLHVDGFQGVRIQPKLPIDHSYIVSDRYPTVFYTHGFDVEHLDESAHNFFLEFDEQAQEEITWKPQPFQICLINAYQVHRSDYAIKNSDRTFVRLSYTLRQFDRLGNTHNPLFDYDWEMVPRDMQATLIKFSPTKEICHV